MSNKEKQNEELPSHSIQNITEILIKHHGIHDGFYELLFEVNVAIGSFPHPENGLLPGAAVTFSKIGLKKTAIKSPNSVDASLINPAPGKKLRVAKKKPQKN